ncbi:serine hydrolase [Nanoarchaeota archaeon]
MSDSVRNSEELRRAIESYAIQLEQALSSRSLDETVEPEEHFISQSMFGRPEQEKNILSLFAIDGHTGEEIININADRVDSSSSIGKLAIAFAVYAMIDSGELKLYQRVPLKQSLLHPNYHSPTKDLMTSQKSSIPLETLLAQLFLNFSNDAANHIVDLIGFDIINETMQQYGFNNTVIEGYFLPKNFAEIYTELPEERLCGKYSFNRTTPREMTMLLYDILNGKLLSKSSCADFERKFKAAVTKYEPVKGNYLTECLPITPEELKSEDHGIEWSYKLGQTPNHLGATAFFEDTKNGYERLIMTIMLNDTKYPVFDMNMGTRILNGTEFDGNYTHACGVAHDHLKEICGTIYGHFFNQRIVNGGSEPPQKPSDRFEASI